MMVNLMRSNQRWLWIVISVLVGISFISFYSDRTHSDAVGTDRVGKIYGRTLTATELQRTERQIRLAMELGLTHLTQREVLQGGDLMAALNNLVLQHEAERMNIYPTDDEVADAEVKLPVFAGANGQFDAAKEKEVMNEQLVPFGFSANQLDELVREDLQVAKLREIVDATTVVTPPEVRRYYERGYAKTEASVIRFQKSDVLATVPAPTEDEIKKYYDEQKDRFEQPERRKVQYVKFGLGDAQKKLTGKERLDAFRPLGDQAVQFLEKLLDQKGKGDYAANAAADKLAVNETGEFDDGQAPGGDAASITGFAEAASKLSKVNPDSDVPLQTTDAFYDLHLSSVVPARPMTLDEARPKIIAAIKDERATAALAAKAEEARTKIEASLKAGHTLPEAARDAGLAVQELNAFSAAEPLRGVPDATEVAGSAESLDKGELSKFEPTGTGGVLVYVRNRQGIDEAAFEKEKAMLTRNLARQKESFFFYEWLQATREAAGAQVDSRLRG